MRPLSDMGLVVFIVLILLLAGLSVLMPSSLAEQGPSAISVTIEPIDEVESDPVEYVMVQVMVNVRVSNFTAGKFVTVKAWADTRELDVTPSHFEVPEGSTEHTETVSMDIEIPPKTSADENIKLSVSAYGRNAQGINYSDRASTNISVKQYYGLRLSQNSTMALEQDNNTTHYISVSNTGNGFDNYTVTLTNRAMITSKGLELEYLEDIYELGKDGMISVPILVTAAIDARLGTVTADFQVTSLGDPSKSVDYHVIISVVSEINPPMAIASILEDPDVLWTDMPINFSSTGSYDIDGGELINFSWDFDDGSDQSYQPNPVHSYESPGTYTVTLIVTDRYYVKAQDTFFLTVQRNYGDTEIIIKVPLESGKTYQDPAQDDIQLVAVMRDGWVAYLCDLRKDQEIVVSITIIGDLPADVYLFNEVDFQTYQDDPQVDHVPLEAEGSKQGILGEFKYSFTPQDTDRYFIVIDNKDWPLGTEALGPVDYTISIKPNWVLNGHPPPGDDFPIDLWIIVVTVLIFALIPVVFLWEDYKRRHKM